MKSIDISNAFLNCIIPLFGFILFVCIYDNSVFLPLLIMQIHSVLSLNYLHHLILL